MVVEHEETGIPVIPSLHDMYQHARQALSWLSWHHTLLCVEPLSELPPLGWL
jgi:hypothetical protein